MYMKILAILAFTLAAFAANSEPVNPEDVCVLDSGNMEICGYLWSDHEADAATDRLIDETNYCRRVPWPPYITCGYGD